MNGAQAKRITTSVIIPTYNGAEKTRTILRSLERQTLAPDQVLVVIDGSTDGTADLLRAETFSFADFRIIEQPNGGRGQVRNRGAAEASGGLLIFFDDDMRPVPACIEEHVSHHQLHPGSILTGGLKEEIVADSKDLLKFKAALSEEWTAPFTDYADTPLPADQAFMTAANCSMPKAVWEKLGGLDVRLNDAEDYDMATRAIRMGIPMYFNARAFAWHDDPVTCARYIRRLRQYAHALENLQAMKPELYGDTHKFAIRKPTGFKAAFFKMFCSPIWIRTIDNDAWTFLPRPLRYKFYNWVVTANGSFYPEKIGL